MLVVRGIAGRLSLSGSLTSRDNHRRPSRGGDHVKIHSLTPGSRDPHFAQAKPSMIRKVYGADLLLLIGADMEIGWLPART